MNQSHMTRRLASVQLTSAERSAFARYHGRMHVLVMTEDWCGDALMNLPILARIVEALPDADLRVFVRTTAVELNAYYTGRDVTKIPVITFLDQDFRELGTWVERPRYGGRLASRVDGCASGPCAWQESCTTVARGAPAKDATAHGVDGRCGSPVRCGHEL